MWIFTTFFQSIFKPQSYLEKIRSKNHNFIVYFLFWMTAIGLGLGVYAQFVELPNLEVTLREEQQNLVENYPEDLAIDWNTESLDVTPESYREFSFSTPSANEISSLTLTYNQNLEAPAGDSSGDTRIFMNSESVFLPGADMSWQEVSLQELPSFENAFRITSENIGEVSQHFIDSLLTFVKTHMSYVYVILILFLTGSRIFLALLYTLLVLLFGRIFGFLRSWKEAWRFTALVFILAELISQITNLTYAELDLPMFMLSFWGITGYVSLLMARKNSK